MEWEMKWDGFCKKDIVGLEREVPGAEGMKDFVTV